MKKPIRMPNVSEQQVLAGVSVRLIFESERLRYDALLDKQHYLKSGQLVGEQLRYVAEYAGEWLTLLSWMRAAIISLTGIDGLAGVMNSGDVGCRLW